MSINVSSLQSSASAIGTGINAISNLIAVTPYSSGITATQQTVLDDGEFVTTIITPPTFLFNYEGEQSVNLESDITDHYIEDNTAIQDQIALKPEIVTTNGFIGDLNDIPPNKAFQIAQTIAQKLTTIGAYAPSISATALLAYNEALYAYSIAAAAVSSVESFGNLLSGSAQNQTPQAKAFQQFYGYWLNRTLFNVVTPWGSFPNMAIKTLTATQDAETQLISDFTVTFKRMRFAQTSLDGVQTTLAGENTSGQLTAQEAASDPTSLGSNQASPDPTPQSSTWGVA